MSVAVIRASHSPSSLKIFAVPLRRALVLALAKAGVTDVVWQGISPKDLLPAFAGAGNSMCRFHFQPLVRASYSKSPGDGALIAGLCEGPWRRIIFFEESEIYFDPAVFRLLLEWPGEAPVEADYEGKPVGLWSRVMSTDAEGARVQLPTHQVFFLQDPDARKRASRAFFRTVALKPTDGIYARFNKRVTARPLIALFLRTPVSANLVTLWGFCFALAGAWAFAQGGYFPMVMGALLHYVSALFDHADGVVARLKLQQSSFGCWLETQVDHGSVLVTFAGIFWGLYRAGENPLWVWLGVATLAGIVSSASALSLHRHRLTAKSRPEEFLRRLYAHMEENRDKWPVRFARKCHFVGRRAFFPYALLAFVLLGQIRILAWMAVGGAQAFWILTLYNMKVFRREPHTSGSPAAVGTSLKPSN